MPRSPAGASSSCRAQTLCTMSMLVFSFPLPTLSVSPCVLAASARRSAAEWANLSVWLASRALPRHPLAFAARVCPEPLVLLSIPD